MSPRGLGPPRRSSIAAFCGRLMALLVDQKPVPMRCSPGSSAVKMVPDDGAVTQPVVLVVEDEMLVRVHMTEMLRQAGYAVLDAANADDAINILEKRNDIRVVFTDVHMPGSMDRSEEHTSELQSR